MIPYLLKVNVCHWKLQLKKSHILRDTSSLPAQNNSPVPKGLRSFMQQMGINKDIAPSYRTD